MPLRASPPPGSGRPRGTLPPTLMRRRRRPRPSDRLHPSYAGNPTIAGIRSPQRRPIACPTATQTWPASSHSRGRSGDLDQHPGAPVCSDVQAVVRNPPGDGAAEVDEVAIAVRARPDHRIGEDDRVRLRPGDLRAETGAKNRLIGRAGIGWHAAELLVRLHQSGAARAQCRCRRGTAPGGSGRRSRRSAWSEPALFRPAV